MVILSRRKWFNECAVLAASSMSSFHYQGEFVFDGDVYALGYDPDTLRDIRDEYQWRPTDILVATYAKSGKIMMTSWNGNVLCITVRRGGWIPLTKGHSLSFELLGLLNKQPSCQCFEPPEWISNKHLPIIHAVVFDFNVTVLLSKG